MTFFDRLKSGLSKTRNQLSQMLGTTGNTFNDTFYESLEEALIAADIGLDRSLEIIEELRSRIKQENLSTFGEAYERLKDILVEDLRVAPTIDEFPPRPWVILVVGVNGVGKTTTIGKMAHELKAQGKKVLLGAADTFRAGAIEQLRIWAQRSHAEFIAQQEGSDAASVAFDALEAAKSRSIDVCILDTAGRLHTKGNLMAELEKVVRVIKRNTPHAPNEILLVIDATTGQNAYNQAVTFHTSLHLTGLIITKLDGTAKGGIALSLPRKLGVPIRKIGVGESMEDLQQFDPRAFVDAMFSDVEGGN